MPRRPSWDGHVADERMQSLHERAGRVLRGSSDVGRLRVEVRPWARRTGGRLWWSRWELGDSLLVHYTVDGRDGDELVHADRLEGEVRDLSRGLFRYRGEVLSVVWEPAGQRA